MKKQKRQEILRRYVWEQDNALEGIFWPLEKRLRVLDEQYRQYWLLTPYQYKPLVKSFNSFEAYEAWKKKQKNPWYW